MSRKVLIVAVVVVVLLATIVAPAVANPLEAGDAASVPAEAWSGFSGGSLVYPLPSQLAGGGCGGGAGDCPT